MSRRVLAPLVVAVAVLVSAEGCLGPKKVPEPPHDPGGVVVATRAETNGQGGPRVAVTIRDADGREWDVRLPPDTRCVRDAHYPECAG